MSIATKYGFPFFLISILSACGSKEVKISPEYRDLTEAVYASGNIYPDHEYKVASSADGFLVRRNVDPGDSVVPGMELFRIENDLQSERLQISERILDKAKENYGPQSPALLEMQTAQKNSLEKLKYDSVNWTRFKNLYESNSTSKIQLDNATLAYQVSKNDYLQKTESLKRIKNQLYVDLQNAENSYNVSRKDVGNRSVTSNIRGRVYDVLKEQGELVRASEVIAILGDADQVYLRLAVDELDIENIRQNQEVLVKLDIAPGKVYKAAVSKIYPKLNREDQSFRVDAVFTGLKPEILYGVTVEANIIIREKKHILTIPKAALQKGDSIWVNVDGKKTKIKMEKGIESFDYVEVLGGIKENDEVFLK